MTLRSYIIGLIVSTIFCWISWILVLIYFNPETSGFIGPLFFYSSLFFALIGTFSLIGFFIRIFISRNEVIFAHAGVSFRQGVLLSLCVVGVLFLQSMDLLTWWSGFLFVSSVILLEFYFISR